MNSSVTSCEFDDAWTLRVPLVFSLVAGLAVFATCFLGEGVDFGSRGDFSAYWAAHQIFWAGGNPYELASLSQYSVPEGGTPPKLIWNPPFFFMLTRPVFSLSYLASLSMLSGLSMFLVLVSGLLVWRIASPKELSLYTWVSASLLLTPVWVLLGNAQLTSILCFALALSIYLLHRNKDFWAGVVLVPLLLKPHLFYLILPLLLLWMLQHKRFLPLLGTLGTLVLLSCGAELTQPGIHTLWLHRSSWPFFEVGSTVCALLRWVLISNTSHDHPVAAASVSMITGAVLYFTAKCKWLPNSTLLESVALALPFSLLFAPYGFIFDQVLFVISQNVLVVRLKSARQRWIILSLMALVFFLCAANEGPWLGWYLPSMGLLALFFLEESKSFRDMEKQSS